MALFKLGPIVTDAHGSVGGLVFSKNRYGQYGRDRITPVNPKSARQSAIRAIIAEVSARWLGVATEAQRAAWDVFGANVPSTNKLGEVIFLTGFNRFVQSNVAAGNAGLSYIETAPIIFTLPGEDTAYNSEIDAGTGKLTITFDDTHDWVDEDAAAMIVQMGIPQNASRSFFDGRWRHAGVILGDGVAAPTTPDSAIDVPFSVADGQKVWTRAKIIRADGHTSDWFRDDSIVASA